MAPKKYEHTAKTFELYPKIVKANRHTQITIRPIFAKPLIESARYTITAAPMDIGSYERKDRLQTVCTCKNNTLVANLFFAHEQEYRLLIACEQDDPDDIIATLHIYAADEDLWTQRPYKGDLHLHSHYSDGRNTPAYIAAASRKAGLDFMAVTDHGLYKPSIEAIRAFEHLSVDLNILEGEEIHPPQTETHMVGIGAKQSIKSLYQNESAYIDQVKRKIENLPLLSNMKLDAQERFEYASCALCVEQVRKDGGICIFAHPFWAADNKYNVSAPLAKAFLSTGLFDAFELFNGDEMDINALQLSLYHDLYKSHDIPLVSGTDAHGIIDHPFFGTFYTVVFAADGSYSSLISAVREQKTTVVYPIAEKAPFAFGNHRLVKFTLYLCREVFPMHDSMAEAEGLLMERALIGCKKSAVALEALKGQTTDFYNIIYG